MTDQNRYAKELLFSNGRWERRGTTNYLETAERAIVAEVELSRGVIAGQIVDQTTNGVVFTTADDFYDLTKSCFPLPLTKTEWESETIYPHMTPQDELLIAEWLSSGDADDKAKMLSARGAEKAAMLFYQSLGFEVEDISIEQLERKTNRWEFFDILVDSRLPVDVKNARTSYGDISKSRYVEHCIKRLKEHNGAQVIIAGVLSPYLQLQYLQVKKPHFSVTPIRFLGQFCKAELQQLENDFRQSNLQLVSVSQEVFPPWLFDYPSEFYRARDRNRASLRGTTFASLPRNLEMLPYNPIPAFLSSGLPLPEIWKNHLHKWQLEFYDEILKYSQRGITLPIVFLSILTHFLKMIESNPSDYFPKRYADLLFYDRKNYLLPLGIYDPLGVVNDLCLTLQEVWSHREYVRLQEFRHFRFDGRGLLQGKRQRDSEFETIIAYCGGHIEGKVNVDAIP